MYSGLSARSHREAVLDAKWYRQAKFIVAALALAIAGSVGAATYASNTDSPATPGASNQCDLPPEQRAGGWICTTP